MRSIKEITQNKTIIKKSTFICTLIPCDDIDDVKNIINEYQEKYHDASHNCLAYIIGNNEKADDNGEPSGTAGLPMLNVLQKQGLENVIAIVTRYFGGIKLGAGGLTRAYTNSVADCIKEANIVEKELVDKYLISVDYTYTKKLEYLLKVNDIEILNTDYNDQVTYTCFIKDQTLFDQIQDLTSNNYTKENIGKFYVETFNKP